MIALALAALGILIAILMLGVMLGMGVSEQYYDLRNASLGIIFSATGGDSYFDRSLRYCLIVVSLALNGLLGRSSTLVVRVFGLISGAIAIIQSYLLIISANQVVAGDVSFDSSPWGIFWYADFFLAAIILGLFVLLLWSIVTKEHQKKPHSAYL